MIKRNREITLPEFFLRLYVLASEADIPTPPSVPGEPVKIFNSPKARMQDRLIHLVKFSEVAEDKWAMHRSAYRSLWLEILPLLRRYNLFAEFEGNTDLSKKLKLFLRGKDDSYKYRGAGPGRW